jgi:hypothetical protein
VRAYEKGDWMRASEELRIASFGLLDSPELLAHALAHLALAQRAGGNTEGAAQTLRRLDELEARFGISALPGLSAEKRQALASAAGDDQAAAETRPCISRRGDGACPELAGPSAEELATLEELAELAADTKAGAKKLRHGFEEARALAELHPDWSELRPIAALLASRSGHYAEAIDFYSRSGDPGDDQPLQLFYLAVALFETDDPQAAADTLRRALPGLERDREVNRYIKRILPDDAPG